MITKDEVSIAQKKWAEALIEIGKRKANPDELVSYTSDVIDRLYAYDIGDVLFKPTRATEVQFRGSKEEALSYFIGGNSKYPEDTGFALQPWSDVKFDNAGGILLREDTAIAMGNYFFTETETGAIKKVEYTFGYVKTADGSLKINLHHSSVPFSPTM